MINNPRSIIMGIMVASILIGGFIVNVSSEYQKGIEKEAKKIVKGKVVEVGAIGVTEIDVNTLGNPIKNVQMKLPTDLSFEKITDNSLEGKNKEKLYVWKSPFRKIPEKIRNKIDMMRVYQYAIFDQKNPQPYRKIVTVQKNNFAGVTWIQLDEKYLINQVEIQLVVDRHLVYKGLYNSDQGIEIPYKIVGKKAEVELRLNYIGEYPYPKVITNVRWYCNINPMA